MSVGGAALDSRLELGFEADARGVTRLVHRRAGGLAHVGKPYWNGDTLLTQLVNPTAGFFAGDRLAAEVSLGPGSSVLLSNPSATRLHTMPSGRSEMSQVFRLAAGSFLEVQPDLLIPQAQAEGVVRTQIEAAAEASFLFLDLLAPGRTARGESLAWREVTMTFDLEIDGTPVVRERARLGSNCWRMLTAEGTVGYLANAWIGGPAFGDLAEGLAEAERRIHGDGVACGASLLGPGFGVLRIFTADSVNLRTACRELRTCLADRVPALRARTGKL